MYIKALKLATKAHKGQYRRGTGAPYIVHPIRVAQRFSGEHEQVVALLHDTLEDTGVRYDDIHREFGKKVADDVATLTHIPSNELETYKQYIQRVANSGSRCAVMVKIADITDNITDHPSDNMLSKAPWALEVLLKKYHE